MDPPSDWRSQAHEVSFDNIEIRIAESTVVYTYSVRNGSFEVLERFQTELHLPFAGSQCTQAEEFTLLCFGVCHLAYVFLPFAVQVKRLCVRAGYLTHDQLRFFDKLFKGALAEYYFLANLDLRDSFTFACACEQQSFQASTVSAGQGSSPRVMVPEGGGKDSTVLMELLHQMGCDNQWMYFGEYVGQFEHYKKLAAVASASPCKEVLVAEQEISDIQRLQQLNMLPDLTFTDYVVYSTLHVFSSVFFSLQHSYNFICVGNEYCANFNHVTHPKFGFEVNHQYEKSFDCEKELHDFIKRYISPDIHYFSGLQHMYEIDIAEKFCKMPQYFDKILSCNCTLDDKWCCVCEKCTFVYLLFAAFLPVSTVMGDVFGRNGSDVPEAIKDMEDMFDSPAHLDTFEALMGLRGYRPLECVGTADEVLASLWLVHNRHFTQMEDKDLPLLFQRHKDLICTEGRQHWLKIEEFQRRFKQDGSSVQNLYPAWYKVL